MRRVSSRTLIPTARGEGVRGILSGVFEKDMSLLSDSRSLLISKVTSPRRIARLSDEVFASMKYIPKAFARSVDFDINIQ